MGVSEILLSGTAVPDNGFAVILWHTNAPFVARGESELGGEMPLAGSCTKPCNRLSVAQIIGMRDTEHDLCLDITLFGRLTKFLYFGRLALGFNAAVLRRTEDS